MKRERIHHRRKKSLREKDLHQLILTRDFLSDKLVHIQLSIFSERTMRRILFIYAFIFGLRSIYTYSTATMPRSNTTTTINNTGKNNHAAQTFELSILICLSVSDMITWFTTINQTSTTETFQIINFTVTGK